MSTDLKIVCVVFGHPGYLHQTYISLVIFIVEASVSHLCINCIHKMRTDDC